MTITQSSTRLVALVAGVAVAVSLFVGAFAAATPAQAAALTQSQISAIISLLQSFGADQATINNVSASLNGQATPGTGTGPACPTLTRDLQQGSTGTDVMSLQIFLNKDAATMVSASGAGSPGMETSVFGPATKSGVMKFQTKYGITPVAGYAGAKTRAQIMSICGGMSTGGGTVPTGPGVSISAAAQPANALVPAGAVRVPFTTFTLTNNTSAAVTVNGITVQRGGLSVDGDFSGVVLLDSSGVQIGISKTLNSNHQTTVGDVGFMLNPGQSMTYTVAGNIASVYPNGSGDIATLSVIAVNTTVPVNGTLPIIGASNTTNSSVTIGSVTAYTSSFDPLTSQNKSIGDTAVKFAGIRLTANSSEAVWIKSITWNQAGSAGATDLANVMTYVDGVAYPTVVSAGGKYYTTTFGNGIFVDKGLSKDMYIQGDIVGSNVASRTIEFDIYKSTDVYLVGGTYGFGLMVAANTTGTASTGSEFTSGSPFFSGSVINVQAGTATSITKETTGSAAAQNIAVNVPNQNLGGFTTNFRGEAVSVQNMVFWFGYGSTAASGNLLTSVSLVDSNGAVVAGPVDAVVNSGVVQKVTFTDNVTFPVGTKTYYLRGKIPTSVTTNDTIVASTTPSSWSNITGQTSGNTLTLSIGSFQMSTMTIKSAKLAVALSTTPASTNLVAGGNAVLFANVQLDASQSGEDVRISNVPLEVSASTGLSTCQLFDANGNALNTGSNVASSLVTGLNSFTLDNSLTVTKGAVTTLGLKCNVSSSASGAYTWSVLSGDWANVTAYGLTSSNTLTTTNGLLTVTSGSGGTMTIGTSGTLAVAKDSSSPSYTLAANGSTGVTLGVLRFTSTNEAVNLNKIALQLSNDSASSSPSDLTMITLWDGATQVGSAAFTGMSRYATSSLTSTVVIAKDSYKLITIKGNLATLTSNAGIGNNAKPGALVQVDYDGNDTTGTQGVGVDSGSTVNAVGTDSAVAGVRVYKSYPVITYAPTSGNLTNGTNPLVQVTITANSSGDISLYKLTFNESETGATLATPTFTGPNGSVGTVGYAANVVTVTFDSTTNTQDRTIAAGTSKTFNLGGTVSGVVGAGGGVVSFALAADSAPSNTTTALMGQATALSTAGWMTIWSPNSTTTSATTNNDWTNGYGLGGCFTSSGLGSNCFAVSKAQ